MGLALIASASRAQVSDQDFIPCRNRQIPPAERVNNCTQLIESGRLQGAQREIGYFDRGLAYWFGGSFDNAITDFNMAISLRPNYSGAYTFRGSAYLRKGSYDNAINDETTAISIKPSAFEYELRAAAYEKKGLRDQAIADYRTVLSLSPASKEAQDGLARLGVAP
jgi:tetratricopeptide (TPR) repeat protein